MHMQISLVTLVKQGHQGRFFEILVDKIAGYQGDWTQM